MKRRTVTCMPGVAAYEIKLDSETERYLLESIKSEAWGLLGSNP